MRTLWPDTFVEEANLSQHIFLLRKALGEKAHESHYIVTVPGKGYRLAQKVQEVSEHGDDLPLPAEQPPRQNPQGRSRLRRRAGRLRCALL
jgi:DNA-binding winged helix-turn-helix (wHTH) protein